MLFLRIISPVFLFSFLRIFLSDNTPVRENPFLKGVSDSTKLFSQNFYPKKNKKDQVIKHAAYTLCYDENFEQAKWVAYLLTSKMCSNNEEERTDNFREDPSVMTGSAVPNDYKKSGYDRGHLCPAGDMGWSEVTMSESFFTSTYFLTMGSLPSFTAPENSISSASVNAKSCIEKVSKINVSVVFKNLFILSDSFI